MIAIAFITYLALTVSKNMYTAEKLTMISDGVGTLETLAGSMRYYSLTYAIGQILLFFFVKKINIRKFLFFTVGLSAVLTVLIGVLGDLTAHYLIFFVNGLIQSGIWGCTLKLLSVHLPSDMLPTATTVMTSGPAVSGALAYGIAAAFGDNWRLPFIILGVLLGVSICGYTAVLIKMERLESVDKDVSNNSEDKEDDVPSSFSVFSGKFGVISFYVLSILIGISLSSFYFIINNNADVYLAEVGGLPHDISKALMMLAPLASTLGPIMIVRSCERYRNFFAVCLGYTLIAAAFFSALMFIYKQYAIASFVLLLLFMVFVNGARSVTLSIAAMKMRKRIDTGRYSMMVNAVSSLAMGITPAYAAGLIENSETSIIGFGKAFSFVYVWCAAVIVLLSVICICLYIRSKKAR